MRKILFALICTSLFSTVIMAQSTRFGATGGVVYSTLFSNINGEKDLWDFKFGGTVGLMADIPMEKNGSFRTGVNFVMKGGKNETTSGNDKIEQELKMNYIEVPLLVMFKVPCKTNGQIRLGGGVSPGFALSGKQSYKLNGTGDEEDIDFGDKTDSDLNWMDFSLNFQAEYEFSGGVFLALGWSQGINRLFVGGSEKDKLYNHFASLRVGYFFGGNK